MFCFLFQAAFLFVVSPVCRHTTCPTTTAVAPPTRILSRYLQKVLQGTESVRDWAGWGEGWRSERGGWWERGEGDGGEGGRKRLSGPFISGSAHTLRLLLLPIVEPWGPGEAAPCLAAMQPLYHSNLLIVGAQLAHGGFLLEPPNIN